MRLDIFLQKKQGVSRSYSQQLIKNENVKVNYKTITKCGYEISESDTVEVVGEICPFVSRAGLKLQGAVKEFDISVKDKVVLDIGSSTGGFSDFCLQNGAKKIYCVDVGNNQLDEKIKNNPKVVVKENTDIRNVSKDEVRDVNFVVCDVSFISLTKISHKIAEFLDPKMQGVILLKPQFECGKEIAKKFKGVIKDEKIHQKIIENVTQDFETKGLKVLKIGTSCIKGGDGNTEYILFIERK